MIPPGGGSRHTSCPTPSAGWSAAGEVDMASNDPFAKLPAFDPETGTLNAVIDTPKGSRNKYKLDEKLGLFRHSGVLPAGASFPFDFGFVPSTVGGDGD